MTASGFGVKFAGGIVIFGERLALGFVRKGRNKRVSVLRTRTAVTRPPPYHGDKMSRLAPPPELIECHSSCGIKS